MKKFFFVIAAVSAALLIAAEVYVQSDSFSDRIRPYVVTQLRQVLGKSAQVGRIRISLAPPAIEARDILLFDSAGRPAAALRKLKVYINPLSLLLKKVSLPSVVLLEPRIFMDRSAHGDLNLRPLLERIRAGTSGHKSGETGFSVLIRTITVTRGSFLFKDRMAGAEVFVSGVQAAARVGRAGDIASLTVRNSDVRLKTSASPEIAGRLSGAARYIQGELHVETLAFSTDDAGVFLSGTIKSFPDAVLNIRVKVRSGPQSIGKMARMLNFFKKKRRSPVEATASITGTLSDPSVRGQLRLSGISYRGFRLHDTALNFQFANKQFVLEGEKMKVSKGSKSFTVKSIKAALAQSEQGLDIRQMEVDAGDLSISLAGRADPEQGFDAVVTAESRGRGQALTVLTSVPVEGRIGLKGYLTGPLNAPIFDGGLSAASVTVRGIDFDNAGGRIEYRDKSISLVSVVVHQIKARYFFTGSVDMGRATPIFDARLKVIRSDVGIIVSLFYKPLPLHFAATGYLSFAGSAREFLASANVSVEAGSAYGESFTGGTAIVSLTRERISFPSVTVDKGSGKVTGSGWIGFDRTYSASFESRGVRLEQVDLIAGYPVRGLFRLTVASEGSFSQPKVAASLETDDIVLQEVSLGGMKAELSIADRELSFTANLNDGRAAMQAGLGLVEPYDWNVRATVSGDEIDPFWLSGNKELQGRVHITTNGRVSVRGKGRNLSALAGAVWFHPLQIVIGDYRIENDADVRLSLKGDRLTITSLDLSGQDTKMTATGNVRFNKTIDVSLAGAGNLSLLRPLFKGMEHSDGAVVFSLSMSGDWKKPQITGEFSVKNGEIKLKEVPQKFYALNGKASFDQGRIVLENLTGEIGGGTLAASGSAGLSGLKLQDFSCRLVFEGVGLRYPEGLVSVLSGELHYDGDLSHQSLVGDVRINRARYDKRIEWKSMLVNVARGFYQKKRTEIGRTGDTQINIRFFGKDDISFQNNLAKMPLEVDMFLRGTINHPQLLGRINAPKGSVYFRQNEFRILHAAVDFVDPNRVNPVLDIQAETQVREYVVRLAVSGTAERAIVTLLSDPPLIDSDILALLALGKTGSELKGKETGVGISEGLSFASGQFQDMFESRARSLTGLDRFQVDPYVSKGDTSVPRVTVGKELVQGKLYVVYSSNVGSTVPEQIFRIEYILNKHFSVVGERNELGNTGADLKYRFEFE